MGYPGNGWLTLAYLCSLSIFILPIFMMPSTGKIKHMPYIPEFFWDLPVLVISNNIRHVECSIFVPQISKTYYHSFYAFQIELTKKEKTDLNYHGDQSIIGVEMFSKSPFVKNMEFCHVDDLRSQRKSLGALQYKIKNDVYSEKVLKEAVERRKKEEARQDKAIIEMLDYSTTSNSDPNLPF